MTYPVQGCDISLWNDDKSTAQHVDFDKMRCAGAQFVFIKTSQACYLDRDYILNWKNAKGKIARGGYHYLDWSTDVKVQAQFWWGVLKEDKGELPPVVDYEENYNCPADAAARLEQFCDEFTRLSGIIPMIYTSLGFWNAHGTTSETWLEHKLWLAQYHSVTVPPVPPKPWTTWTFWQYTSLGVGQTWGGDAESMDLDVFRGTHAEYEAEFGLKPVLPTLEDRVANLEARVSRLESEVSNI